MSFYADLHVHSKYSRATSKHCDLEHLAYWARKKGIAVVGTGDFTHPAWRAELESKLEPAEPGLFRLRPDLERAVAARLGGACRAGAGAAGSPGSEPAMPRFMLSVEISTIYKKADASGDKTRKVHHLVYAPDFAAVDAIRAALSKIGNLNADGRPILGLDSRDLLEIVLEARAGDAREGAYLVPAHVWTPWFAALGSKSGFDRVADCYGDLAEHIFAIETGLSSDPEMNWRLSQLDRYTLVSNSDAHSPAKLGREATELSCALEYAAIRRALETREGLCGTVEFFPEEGKYHLDGHRKCGVVLDPDETRERGGLCPVCERPVTVGVMNRVLELADRPAGFRPEGARPYRCLVPLPEVIGEITRSGAGTRTVARNYEELLARAGDELTILQKAPIEELARAGGPLLAEAVARMRAGRVIRKAGFDGEYGVIRLFEDDELAPSSRGRARAALQLPGLAPPAGADDASRDAAGERGENDENDETHKNNDLSGGCQGRPVSGTSPMHARPPDSFFTPTEPGEDTGCGAARAGEPSERAPRGRVSEPRTVQAGVGEAVATAAVSGHLAGLDPDQRQAAEIGSGPLLVVAGPGTGKTRVLTHRIAHLIDDREVSPRSCLAITFTNRAAREMRERLAALLPDASAQVEVATFHALALAMLREHRLLAGLHRGFRIASERERVELLARALECSPAKATRWLARLARAARRDATHDAPGPDDSNGDKKLAEVRTGYRVAMERAALIDLDEIVPRANALLEREPAVRDAYIQRYRYVSIDEYQDVDEQQYRLIRTLCPPGANVCAIGDPDQAIYGFRGADVGFFLRFRHDYPDAREVRLTRSYRSTPAIVDLAMTAIAPDSLVADRTLRAVVSGGGPVVLHESRSERAEAEFVVHTIEALIGGTSFFSLDTDRVATAGEISLHSDSCADGLGFSDFAVLYRTGAQVEPLVEAFARSGMPFQHRSHARLAELPAVAALISGLGLRNGSLRERLDEAAAELRAALGSSPTPASATGSTLDSAEAAPGDDKLAALTAVTIDEALGRLVPLCDRFDHVDDLLDAIACGVEVDTWDPRADRISLLTLHAAKGLEFPVVFVVGCEDGILPLRFGPASRDARDDVAEERRLLFVGITRARRALYLTRALERSWRGAAREMAPSPFLADIRELLERSVRQPHSKKRAAGREQLPLF